jgi:hypothetical protein
MKTLKDLIDKYTWDEVGKKYFEFVQHANEMYKYDDSLNEEYRLIYEYMQTHKPIDSLYTIHIKGYEYDDGKIIPSASVSQNLNKYTENDDEVVRGWKKAGDLITYAMELLPFEYWSVLNYTGMKIAEEAFDRFSEIEIIAACWEEIRWAGYFPEYLEIYKKLYSESDFNRKFLVINQDMEFLRYYVMPLFIVTTNNVLCDCNEINSSRAEDLIYDIDNLGNSERDNDILNGDIFSKKTKDGSTILIIDTFEKISKEDQSKILWFLKYCESKRNSPPSSIYPEIPIPEKLKIVIVARKKCKITEQIARIVIFKEE